MPKHGPDGRSLSEWIAEVERDSPKAAADLEGRLGSLLGRVIQNSPRVALHFLRRHRASGIDALTELPSLLTRLGHRLMDGGKSHEIEELVRLMDEWGIAIDDALLADLGAGYAREGWLDKAREVFRRVLKSKPRQASGVRGLYEIAKREELTSDAQALLTELIEADPSPATVAFTYRERRRLPPEGGPPIRIALVSSYVLDQLIPHLDFECRKIGLVPEFYQAPFNQYGQEILQESSALYEFKPEIVFVALALEDLAPETAGCPSAEDLERVGQAVGEQMVALVQVLCDRCPALIVVHEFVLVRRRTFGILDNKGSKGLVGWCRELNQRLAGALRSLERVHLLPLNEVIGSVGKKHAYDPKMWFMARMLLSEAALPELARYSMRYVKPLKGLTRKCVVLDLDGTPWGGILGELGPDGIHLGPTAPGVEYVDFQRALLDLSQRGILLAVCSKNNLEDALAVIRNHEYMVLREGHFSAIRINWRNKAENIREIAEELNIGLEAMVFIDDNATERELVRQLLPEVLTVEPPSDPSRYRTMLEDMSDFELLAITREDELRGAQYQAMQRRRAARRAAVSLEQYLHSLEIKAEIGPAGGIS